MDKNALDVTISDAHRVKIPKQTIFFLIVSFVILLSSVYLKFFISQQKDQQPVGPKQVQLNPDQKRLSMEMAVKSTFTSSKDKNIISWINLAAKETDQAKKYQYYVKAAAAMASSYKYSQNRTQKQKNAMLAVKNYASQLLGYREADFVIPN